MPGDALVRELLELCGLSGRQIEINRAAAPAISIRSGRSTATDLAPTTSKFGGLTSLPAETGWPVFEGEFLPFLGQINLADIAGHPAAEDLPADGLLQFFYTHVVAGSDRIIFGDAQDTGAWRVRYIPADDFSALESAEIAPPPSVQYSETALAWYHEITFPDACPFEGSGEETGAYGTFVNELSKRFGGDEAPWEIQAYGSHRLLGHWLGVQFGDVLAQAHATSTGLDWWSGAPVAPIDAQDWRLLLQVDCDAAAGFDWAGSGMAYFCIPRRDLAARRFDRVWLIYLAT